MSLRRRVLRVVAIATAVAMVFGAFAGAASAKKISKAQKATISKQLRKQIKKNPRAIRSKSFLRKAALVNFKLPVTIRLRGECPAGSGGAASCPADTVGTLATPASTSAAPLSANVDLGPSLGQRKVNLRGSLAAEVQFRDSYDGGALGNVSIEILPSRRRRSRTNSVPLLWNPDVDSLSSRIDANFARAAIRAGASVAPAPRGPWLGEQAPGLHGFKNEAAPSSRTFALSSTFAGGVAGDGSYSALWYGTLAAGPERWSSGLPGHRPGRSSLTSPAYFLPVFPGIDSLNNLAYGTGFPADWRSGRVPRLRRRRRSRTRRSIRTRPRAIRRSPATRVTRCSAPTRCRSSIAPAGQQVDLATGTPIAPNTLPDRSGFAERHHRQVRWRGEPVREHPGQGLRH